MNATRDIDLSADLGEGSACEDEIWPLIGSANVACGGHTGDAASMREAVRFARLHSVRLGAHPSYPDREHFGRRSMDLPSEELRRSLISQVTTLRDIATEEGVRLRHVKPHGALYNDLHLDAKRATVVADAMLEVDPSLSIVCGETSAMAAVAQQRGLRIIREAFADRRYTPDGSLVSRSDPRACLGIEDAAEQARLLAREGCVVTVDGSRLPLEFDTLCVHADMENAVARLQAIRSALFDR
ncbi:MAG TPA: 5-oxoprolinase subunit PxpA [Thermoanaerobaculia bacterium]